MSHESDESAPCESVVLFSCALDRIGVSKNGEPVEFHWLFNHTVTYSCVHTRLSFSICCYSKTQFKWLHWWQDYSPLGSGMLAEFSGAQYWYIFSLAWDLTLTLLAAIWINYFNHCSLRFTALGITEVAEPGKWKTTQDKMRVMSERGDQSQMNASYC